MAEFYECSQCGELDVERPFTVQVVANYDGQEVTTRCAICRKCFIKAGGRTYESDGSWAENQRVWFDVIERLRGEADRD